MLLVEDEDGVRRIIRRVLERNGCVVVEATSGPKGLARAREEGAALDALILDVVLPGGYSGPEIAVEVQQAHPDMGCVLVSGWTFDDLRRYGASNAGCVFLAKPFTHKELLTAVACAVEWRRRSLTT